MSKAQVECAQAISTIESQLKFLDQAECFDAKEKKRRVEMICSSDLDRTEILRRAEEELKSLENVSIEENTLEVNGERETCDDALR